MNKKELQQLVETLKDEVQGYKNLEEVTQTILDNTRKEISQLQYDLEQSQKETETAKNLLDKSIQEREDLIKKAVTADRVNLRDTISQISLWNFRRVKNQLLELCK